MTTKLWLSLFYKLIVNVLVFFISTVVKKRCKNIRNKQSLTNKISLSSKVCFQLIVKILELL